MPVLNGLRTFTVTLTCVGLGAALPLTSWENSRLAPITLLGAPTCLCNVGRDRGVPLVSTLSVTTTYADLGVNRTAMFNMVSWPALDDYLFAECRLVTSPD